MLPLSCLMQWKRLSAYLPTGAFGFGYIPCQRKDFGRNLSVVVDNLMPELRCMSGFSLAGHF